MMAARSLVGAAAGLLIASATTAHADPDSYNPDAFNLSAAIDRDVAAAPRGIELAVGGGYLEGGGAAGGQLRHVGDLSGAGGGVEVQVGARLSPRFAVGAYGSVARLEAGNAIASGTRVFGASAGLQAAVHARPTRSVDPWVSVGAGWRGMWLAPSAGERTSLQGVELARVQLGVDYRITPSVAVTPVIGASAAMFLAADSPMTQGMSSIGDKAVHYYVFSGLLGRFDL